MADFIPSLKQSGRLDRMHMTVCNVGSRKLSSRDDYVDRGWGLFAPKLTIYGFDADADACDAANQELEERHINWKEIHIPLALGKATEERTLYVTKHPMCSSLYPPNETYISRIADLAEFAGLDFSFELDTVTLDSFCQDEGIHEIDFLQIDVQGADLDVLQGAIEILNRSVLALQVEVEFSHLYIGQPLFADVDSFLRNHDFTFFDLSPAHRLRSGSPIRSTIRAGQLLWADAVYFRDLIDKKIEDPERILKLACIVDILSFPDYALELLVYITLQYGGDPNYNFTTNIIESLARIPELLDLGLEHLPIVQSLGDYILGYDFDRLKANLKSKS
jgi:FkbM family methyltransferase